MVIKFLWAVVQVLQQDSGLINQKRIQGDMFARIQILGCVATQGPEIIAIADETSEVFKSTTYNCLNSILKIRKIGLHLSLKNRSCAVGIIIAPLFQEVSSVFYLV